VTDEVPAEVLGQSVGLHQGSGEAWGPPFPGPVRLGVKQAEGAPAESQGNWGVVSVGEMPGWREESEGIPHSAFKLTTLQCW